MRMKTSLATLMAVLWLADAAAALECRVVTSDGTALSGARVSVVGRGDSLLADRNGWVTIEPTPETPFVLFVARPDGVALRPVTVAALPEEGPLTVIVAPAGETVNVVSGMVPDLELPPAAAATVMGRGDLAQRLPAQLFQTLENLPGSEVSGDGHAAVPSLRGLPQDRTLLLLDDGRVSSERRAGPSASYLDPETVEEVEVVRGPGSVAYGSSAFGGIIRSRTRLPDTQGTQSLRWSAIGGLGLDEVGAAAEFTTGLLGGGVMVGAHYRDYGDYDSPEARNVGKPSPDSAVQSVFYPIEQSNRLGLGFERPGPGSWSRIGVSVAWDDYRVDLDKDRMAAGIVPRKLAESRVDANDFSIRADAERPLGSWRMVLGVDVSGRYDLNAVNETTTFAANGEPLATASEVSIESARGTDSGAFATFSRGLGIWNFNFGVRGDLVTSRNRGGYFGDLTTSNSAVSGFAAVGVDLGSGLELTGQVARGFRDPLLSDRYYRGVTGRGFITGNPDLDPETSLQFDFALRFTGHRTTAGLYAYKYRIDDLIERYRVGDNFFFRNHGDGEIRGLEVEGSLVISPALELQVGAQVLEGETLEDGMPTDGVPAPGVFAVLRGEPTKLWWWMVRGAAFASDDRPGPTEQDLPGYAVLDAGAGYTVTKWLSVEVLGRNLLNRSYLSSSDEAAVLAPGRSLQFVLRGRL
jgi:outer membrane receptor protein involved in Fe transport